MSNPTVHEIIIDWLKNHGYDGLYAEDVDCGCELSDLIPCGFIQRDCRAGYKVMCSADCDHGQTPKLGTDWHVQAEKEV